jgi:hypothetical protein
VLIEQFPVEFRQPVGKRLRKQWFDQRQRQRVPICLLWFVRIVAVRERQPECIGFRAERVRAERFRERWLRLRRQ